MPLLDSSCVHNPYISLPALSDLCFEEHADTKWCVSESFRNQICWQDGLQPDVCSINTAIASCKDSGRTSVNSREIEKEFVHCTALLNLISYTCMTLHPWLDYCERCRPGIWMKALLLFHQMPAQCLYTDANGLGATLASCQGSSVCASLSGLLKICQEHSMFQLGLDRMMFP